MRVEYQIFMTGFVSENGEVVSAGSESIMQHSMGGCIH